eukprot:CAMPEP_0197666118 /NCGR_PEP_ID=MMETSP1338-20131121/61573_1 /TAXON_ID=43686 ORGANISM="Pelagodinium beii, Strain RCC1491" /NCGR_SAMPLE_ID=MMETSP1338 /ASSEMBLY_ACC=CAM_ASM_000754 /LENGTH=305 /DNA_ID=CAMNT_0043245091 /DNA_START=67 /DNA_END=984 /DNA_ORIENTATION=-
MGPADAVKTAPADVDAAVEDEWLSGSPTCSTYDFPQPQQTMIFLDWDDTLFPTSQLLGKSGWNLQSRPELWSDLSLTQLQESMLEEWQQALYEYLSKASAASDAVVILTNSVRPWVDHCLEAFAGKMCSAIKNIPGLKVVYAREYLPRAAQLEHRGCPVRVVLADPDEESNEHHQFMQEAKFQAMKKEVNGFYAQRSRSKQTSKNIISIGDAYYERNAAQDLAFRCQAPQGEILRLKTIVTPAEPSIALLTCRLKLGSALGLGRIAEFDDDLDLDMNSKEGMQELADKLNLSWASFEQMLPVAAG